MVRAEAVVRVVADLAWVVAAEEAVHIGDSVEEDVAGARAAGIEPWLLVRDAGRAQAPAGTRTLASLREA